MRFWLVVTGFLLFSAPAAWAQLGQAPDVWTPAGAAAAAPTVDVPSLGSGRYTGTTGTCTLGTLAAATENIFVFAMAEQIASITGQVVTSVADTASLAYTRLTPIAIPGPGASNSAMEVWWARDTGTHSGDVITVNTTNASSGNADVVLINCVGVKGANATTPIALSGGGINSGLSGTPTSTAYSIATTPTLIFSSTGMMGAVTPCPGTMSPTSGWTTLAARSDSFNNYACMYVQYQSASATVSGATVANTFTFGGGAADGWGIRVDAVKP